MSQEAATNAELQQKVEELANALNALADFTFTVLAGHSIALSGETPQQMLSVLKEAREVNATDDTDPAFLRVKNSFLKVLEGQLIERSQS